jgi:hypothetical protein
MWPKLYSVPAGRQVQLVVRNLDTVEHHYHILGMETVGMKWLTKELQQDGGEQDVHEAHHATEALKPYHICTSRSGVCATGDSVHAHAEPNDRDVIVFVTDQTGKYRVVDPLNEDLVAEVVVF